MQIKKTEFRNLWEKDKKKETFWRSYERILSDELIFRTPFWICEIKNARLWLWVYRSSILMFFISGILVVVFDSW